MNLRTQRRVLISITSVAVVLLGGCTGSLLETKFAAPTTYVLASLPASGSKTSSTVDIAIAVPAAAPGLDTERIATLHEARRLDYYQDARWGATAAVVVQSMIVTSLQNQQLFRSVTPEQARVSATHLLDLQLRDFQAEYASEGAAPTVRVTLVATLVRLKDRKLVTSFSTTAAVRAQENRLNAVLAAFESASHQVIKELSEKSAAVLVTEGP